MTSLRLAALILCLTCLAGPADAADQKMESAGADAGSVSTLSGRGVPLSMDSYGAISVSGANASSAASWQPMESLRVELEYSYRGRNALALAPGGIDGNSAGTISLMANAMVDVKLTDWMTPYVGIGVGMTRLEADRLAFGLGTGDARGESFGYQGFVGVNVPVNSRFSLFADGRYTRPGDFAFTGVDAAAPHSLAESWTALAGIRFTFGR